LRGRHARHDGTFFSRGENGTSALSAFAKTLRSGVENRLNFAATNLPTGALHASVLKYFGVDAPMYGNPAGAPIAGF
jgi:hypothetical protein